MPRAKKVWADPNREGKSSERKGQRYCTRCGNTVQQARILKSMNLCEFCIKEFEAKRDGVHSCRGCGQVVSPDELRENKGYCHECVCPACGRPDPQQVRKTGMCFQCSQTIGDFCRACGKEAAAQVRKNRGLCDSCTAQRVSGNSISQSSGRSARRSDNHSLAGAKRKPRRSPTGKFGSNAGKGNAPAATEFKSGRRSGMQSATEKFAATTTQAKAQRQPIGKSTGLQRKK